MRMIDFYSEKSVFIRKKRERFVFTHLLKLFLFEDLLLGYWQGDFL